MRGPWPLVGSLFWWLLPAIAGTGLIWICLLACWNGLCILASLCWFCAALGLVPSGLAEAATMDSLWRLPLSAAACCFVGALSVWARFSPQCPDCFVCWSYCMDVMLTIIWFDACSREPVPFYCSISAILSCLWFVQGSLFPLLFVQQACLAYDLFKGLCSLFLVLLVSSVFLIYNILTFDQKKKRHQFLESQVNQVW